ncbi:MAG TPA: glycosyltransferase family 4 protein [Anaerolineales bacterium]|nr:glycosyltransferase family 4 protein [Anaerolineales bacterium]
MKIGLVIYGSLDTLSGGYYYDRRLVDSLRGRGNDVVVYSLPWRNYAAHLADNLRFRLPLGLDLLIQDELNHPSLLTANSQPHPYPVVSLVHHLRSSEEHPGLVKALYRLVERGYLRSVDGFVFNSKTTAKAVQSLAGETKPSLCAYPPTDRFGSPLAEGIVARRAACPGPLRVLFVGNVIRRKGLHTLVEALARLPAGSATLTVVGSLTPDPAYARKIRGLVASLGLMQSVSFRGILEDDSLRQAMQESDLLAVPSSYEGFGIVYAEGMGFGLPAIGTSAGAAGEAIEEAGSGYLIQPGDVTGLAERLAALQSDRKLLGRLSLGALERYRRVSPWEKTAGEVHDFLQKMVS